MQTSGSYILDERGNIKVDVYGVENFEHYVNLLVTGGSLARLCRLKRKLPH